MSIRGLAASAALGVALLLAGCGGGSGRSGTDLAVSGTVSPSSSSTTPIFGGTAVVFKMTVINNGQYPAETVTLRNSTTQISESTLTITCAGSGGATCPTAFGSTMTVPSIPAGGSLVFTISGQTAQGANGTFSDTLNVNADTTDTNGNNNTASVTGLVVSSDINVTASTGAPTSLTGGASATLSYVIGNAGPATASDVTISNALTSGLTSGGAITCVAAGGAVLPVQSNGSLLSPSIPVGGTLTCSVPVVAVAGTNGNESSTMTISTSSDLHTSDNSAKVTIAVVSADLGVSESGATQVGAGSSTTFTAVVANPRGQGDANNVTIDWTTTIPTGSHVTFAAPTCSALGGATCPTTLGSTMTLPTLSPGGQLTFTFTANTTSTDRGNIVSTVKVSSDGDSNPANNTASSTTTVVNANNGSYSVYATNGLAYTLAIDFDQNTYTMAGNGTSVTHTFAAGSTSGDYVVASHGGTGSVNFRVAPDLIVGGHDFATTGAVQPYVAARNFVTSLSQGGGAYDIGTRTVSGSTAVVQAGTAQISDGALAICQGGPGVVTAVSSCASASKTSFTVTGPTNNLFTATNTVDHTVYSFALVNSGAVQYLLSASGGQFRIGVPDTPVGLIGGTLRGPSTTGDWLTMTLTASNYAFTGSLGSDSAPLSRINGSAGPNSMLQGLLVSNDDQMYVMQAGPLAVAIGTDTGLVQLAVP